MRKELFMDSRELAIQRANQRQQLRLEELDRMRNDQELAIITAPGAGCGHCLVVGRSVPSETDPDDMCKKSTAYLPIHIDLDNQRPNWCTGFERKLEVESNTDEQQELPL
jgi:hypothetical protein